jgi:hypothetical protein
MQVLACIIALRGATFKHQFASDTSKDEHGPHRSLRARGRRAPAMMAPVIILGAIMMFVFWDTADRS